MTVTTVHDGFQTRKSPIAIPSRALNKLTAHVMTVDEVQILEVGVTPTKIVEPLE